MRLRVTPSRADLAFACGWPFRPDVEVEEQDVGAAADHGTAVHAAIERGALPDDATDDVRRDYKTWLRWVREAGFPADTAEKELALAYDWRTVTARRLAPQHARDYSGATDTEVAGTIDAMWRDGDGTLTVVDWKTGRQDGLPSAAQSGQLALCGLMAARLCEVERVLVGYVHLRDDGTWWDDWHVYEADDLVRLAERVAALMESLPSAEPKPGVHCTAGFGCPALAVCPTSHAALARMTALEQSDKQVSIRITDENAGALYLASKKARALLDALDKMLAAHVKDAGGVALPGGERLERVKKTRSLIDMDGPNGPQAEEWLADNGLSGAITYRIECTPEEARNVMPLLSAGSVKAKTSWEAIRKAARAAGKAMAQTEREARASLTAIGAVGESKPWDEWAIHGETKD